MPLLVAQGIDGIEAGSLPGREETENNTHGGGKKKGYDHDAGVEDKGNLQQPGKTV